VVEMIYGPGSALSLEIMKRQREIFKTIQNIFIKYFKYILANH